MRFVRLKGNTRVRADAITTVKPDDCQSNPAIVVSFFDGEKSKDIWLFFDESENRDRVIGLLMYDIEEALK